MKSRFFLLSSMTLLPALAFGQDYRCSQGGLERRVSIVYETGVAVPCAPSQLTALSSGEMSYTSLVTISGGTSNTGVATASVWPGLSIRP